MRRRVVVLAAVVASFGVPGFRIYGFGAIASAQDSHFHDSSGRALDAFHQALQESDQRVVRIAVYGASHTAGDAYTGELRRRLQARYGDGGPGWVMAATPFAFYHHERVAIAANGWTGRKIRGRERRRDHYGYAGFFVEGTNVQSELHTDTPVAHAVVHYLQHPRAGVLYAEGQASERLESGPRAFRSVDLGATQSVRLRSEGEARVFGVSWENERGVVVDSLGVPGARVWDQEPWREAGLRAHLAERPVDLVAFAYGTNEAANARVSIADYRRRLGRVLRRWRTRAPQASCLLVGPGDWPKRTRRGYVPRPRLTEIIRVQRRAASAHGCAFFDTFAMMGGEGSMVRWVAEGLALSDHVHFTEAGYQRMGAALFRSIQPSGE
ncbi:MAG: GDSL-type esterase/lipase family protein [Myxococcota bacterium]